MRKIVFLLFLAGVFALPACSFEPSFKTEADEKLYRGIERGEALSSVRESVAEGADIDALTCGRVIRLNMVEFAVRSGRDDVAAWLVENGADVNHKTSILGQTLLMYMAEAAKPELCALLLSRGADVGARDRLNNSALEYAFKGGADVPEEELARVVDLLTDSGADVTRGTLTAALCGYSGRGDGDCRYGLVRRVVLALREKGEPTKLSPALEAAVTGGDWADGAAEREQKQILFFTAAFGRVESLSKAGADAKSADRDGNTPLITAARYGNTHAVRYLLTAGADAGAKNSRGETALDAAVKSGDAETIKLLESRQKAAAAMSPAENAGSCAGGCACKR
ncbi:MAG: ankyrin repeat domain-containing protein [Oscillospiraceae bacterium]|jgi:ankyrin repeat protein|nr:ankyrin repeat domain-containing protein [Oscillospiraceae bacterium]